MDSYSLASALGKVDNNCCRKLKVEMFTNISIVASYAGIYYANFSETTKNRGWFILFYTTIYGSNRVVLLACFPKLYTFSYSVNKFFCAKYMFSLVTQIKHNFVLPIKYQDIFSYFFITGLLPVYRNQANRSLYLAHLEIKL